MALAEVSDGGYAVPQDLLRASLATDFDDEDIYIVLYDYAAQVTIMSTVLCYNLDHHQSDLMLLSICNYVFVHIGQEEDEMTVSRGELLQVLDRGEDGWWTVERYGLSGAVPGNYLAKV